MGYNYYRGRSWDTIIIGGGVGVQLIALTPPQFFIQLLEEEGRDPIIRGGGVGIDLTGLALPHFCACPKPVYGLSNAICSIFCV